MTDIANAICVSRKLSSIFSLSSGFTCNLIPELNSPSNFGPEMFVVGYFSCANLGLDGFEKMLCLKAKFRFLAFM